MRLSYSRPTGLNKARRWPNLPPSCFLHYWHVEYNIVCANTLNFGGAGCLRPEWRP